MLANYTRSAKALSDLLKREGVEDTQVLSAIADIPRHIFIDDVLKHKAYENTALPIGQGQTISQPYIVARMTELLRLAGVRNKVLEIGTGSGYQTAILSKLSKRVYSVERHRTLKRKAEALLLDNNFRNVICILGDGSLGIEKQAPFDRIIVSAAAEDIPKILIKQLKYGGIMILPVGMPKDEQTLIKVKKEKSKNYYEEIFKVRFVPLVEGLPDIRNYING